MAHAPRLGRVPPPDGSPTDGTSATLSGRLRWWNGLDVLIAYAIGVGANYLGARLVFKPTTGLRRHALRYLSVVAANFLTTAVLAWWLHRIGADNIISVYPPVAVTAVPTFALMRNWVFDSA